MRSFTTVKAMHLEVGDVLVEVDMAGMREIQTILEIYPELEVAEVDRGMYMEYRLAKVQMSEEFGGHTDLAYLYLDFDYKVKGAVHFSGRLTSDEWRTIDSPISES